MLVVIHRARMLMTRMVVVVVVGLMLVHVGTMGM